MDAEAEAPVLWTPDAKNCLMGKYPDAGKDLGQEKGMTKLISGRKLALPWRDLSFITTELKNSPIDIILKDFFDVDPF